jgi:RNA polymerase sigma-70 factor, ECF subfamily
MDLKEELQLVEEAKTNIQSFNRLYKHYLPQIFSFCMNRVISREVAEDITSDVFISAVEGIRKFNTSKGIRFGSWLYRVAHNKIVDHIRKNKKSFISLEDFGGEISEHTDLDKVIVVTEIQTKIALVLSQLNPRYQEIISLRFYSELSNDEIAGELGANTKQIALVMHRALESFKDKFEKLYPGTEIYDLF